MGNSKNGGIGLGPCDEQKSTCLGRVMVILPDAVWTFLSAQSLGKLKFTNTVQYDLQPNLLPPRG